MDRGKLLQRLAVRLGLRDAAPAGGDSPLPRQHPGTALPALRHLPPRLRPDPPYAQRPAPGSGGMIMAGFLKILFRNLLQGPSTDPLPAG